MSLGSGALGAGSYDIIVDGTLIISTGSLAVVNPTIGTGGVVNAGSSLIEVSGNWTNNGSFNAGSGTVSHVSSQSASLIFSYPL